MNYTKHEFKKGDTLYASQLNEMDEQITVGVTYTEQTLAEEQKVQARENIGAVSEEDVKAIMNGETEPQFSETGDVVELAVEAETPLSVVSKIHRDSTWGVSNKLVLHQVSGSNFFDLTAYLGGAGTVFTKNGLTATVNADSTVTISGTNESTSRTVIIYKNNWGGEQVYPAGTYTIPSGFTMAVRAAQYPNNEAITGIGNLNDTVTIPEPFRIILMQYGVAGGATVDVTLPLGLFRGSSIPETGYEYSGNTYTVTFDFPVYDGEFNWSTGELKDADGNLIAYYDSHDITSLEGMNYFWTGFGENTVSNRKDDGKVILRLNETAPEETIPSICDFMFTPTTPEAAYGLYYAPFLPNGQFCGNEVPVLTTKGTLSVKDADGNVKYGKYIEPIFNARGVADVLTHKGLEKRWSEKFYLTKEPVSITQNTPAYDNAPVPYVFVWEFDESEFINTGIPAKIHDIPMASPCFINNDKSENNVNTQVLWNGDPYPAFFSYDAETGKYVLTARGIQGGSIKHQLTGYSKVHFYYQLESPYNIPFAFAMGIDAGDQISFEADLSDNQPYIDAINNFQGHSVDPSIVAFIPRNVEDAMGGMNNAAAILNMDDDATGGDATVQGYSWIGDGDGVTDYTAKIQNKLNELHTVSNGGTIHLGSGTYPISNSLIVYNNTRIVGNGKTIIEQRADNTHAIIWNGSNIRMCDLTIKLACACTEITACIFANSNNTSSGVRDERYPENTFVQFCSTSNVTLVGNYGFSRDDDGYSYLSEETLAYRGVGVYAKSMYFNYYDCDGLICRHLYAGVCGTGSANNYRMYATETRFPVRGGGSNSMYSIIAHSYYANGRDGKVIGAEYAYYGENSTYANIEIRFYDSQYAKGTLYFDGASNGNYYEAYSMDSGISTGSSTYWETGYAECTDYGRGNISKNVYKECFIGIGPTIYNLSGLPFWNTQFNPSIHNALSGAGIWGNITSNKNWSDSDGIGLSDVCRYPKETLKTYYGLASTVCESSPSEESPIEIIIDISDRPVTSYSGFWIQFDHRFVAEEYTVSFDTTNDGVFNRIAIRCIGNNEAISYDFKYQEPSLRVYRIKISITKALQIPEFNYMDGGYNNYTVNYNPDGLIGIVNIGMPSNEAYGRAFLGECGGSLYGNVDMHQNTLKNLSTPVDDGDVVNLGYLNDKSEVWTFTMADGSTVEKRVALL
jgi:hypothetical protein